MRMEELYRVENCVCKGKEKVNTERAPSGHQRERRLPLAARRRVCPAVHDSGESSGTAWAVFTSCCSLRCPFRVFLSPPRLLFLSLSSHQGARLVLSARAWGGAGRGTVGRGQGGEGGRKGENERGGKILEKNTLLGLHPPPCCLGSRE